MLNEKYLENLKSDVRVYRIKSSDYAIEELLKLIQDIPLDFNLDLVTNIISVKYKYGKVKTTSSSLISVNSNFKDNKELIGQDEEAKMIELIIKKINSAMPSLKAKKGVILITYYHLLLNLSYNKMEELKLYPSSRRQFYEDKKEAMKRIKYAIGLE